MTSWDQVSSRRPVSPWSAPRPRRANSATSSCKTDRAAIGLQGEVVAVHPSDEILDRPAYSSLAAVPGGPIWR